MNIEPYKSELKIERAIYAKWLFDAYYNCSCTCEVNNKETLFISDDDNAIDLATKFDILTYKFEKNNTMFQSYDEFSKVISLSKIVTLKNNKNNKKKPNEIKLNMNN